MSESIKKVSEKGIAYLIEREGGMILIVHDDGFGFPTVGVGHLVLPEDNLKIGDKITIERGNKLLQGDLMISREAVERCVKPELSQAEFDALCIWVFNIGIGNFKNSTLLKRLNTDEDKNQVVKDELPKWRRVGGEIVNGLYNRRIDTVQMFVDGDYTVDWSGLEGQV